MELEFGDDQQQPTQKKSPLKKFMLMGVGVFIVIIAVASVGIFLGLRSSESGVNIPPGGATATHASVKTEPATSLPPTALRKEIRNQPIKPEPKPENRLVRIEVDRNPFKDFYERKYLSKIEERLKKEILDKVKRENMRERDILLARLKKELRRKKPEIGFKVHAVVCTPECYAITSEGVKKDGDPYRGYRLRITQAGVRIDGSD